MQESRLSRFSSIVLRAQLVLALSMLCGCSVMLAASSPKQPDLSKVRMGASRVQVEQQLGKPIAFLRTSGGDIATYTYLGPDKVNYKRAAAYAVADILTLGVAEIVSSPVERLQNDQHVLTITYDFKGRVKSIEENVKEAPLDRPEKMLGLEEPEQA